MNYNQLTINEKERLKRYGCCKICNQNINKDEEFIFDKIQIGKCVKYEFYHKKCINSSS